MFIEFIRSSSKGIILEESSLVLYYSLLLLPLELVVVVVKFCTVIYTFSLLSLACALTLDQKIVRNSRKKELDELITEND